MSSVKQNIMVKPMISPIDVIWEKAIDQFYDRSLKLIPSKIDLTDITSTDNIWGSFMSIDFVKQLGYADEQNLVDWSNTNDTKPFQDMLKKYYTYIIILFLSYTGVYDDKTWARFHQYIVSNFLWKYVDTSDLVKFRFYVVN